jgi:hypothetical protein
MTDSTSLKKYEDSVYASMKTILALEGAQDHYMIADKTTHIGWNMKKHWLSKPHRYKYEYIGCFGGTPGRNRKISMTIPLQYHMISDLELILEHEGDSDYNIDNAIKVIEVEIGGQRIDRLSSMREVELNCQLISPHRKVTTTKNKHGKFTSIIPLELAPFHGNEAFPLVSLYRHEMKIIIGFGDFPVDHAEIWGKTYIFYADTWKLLTNVAQEFMTIQTQFTGEEEVTLGKRNIIRLNFNHPITCIYFWGIDKQYIAKIRFQINGMDYIVTSPEILERLAKQKGIERTDDTLIIFLDDGDITKPYSWLNFSCIDNATLTFDLYGNQDEEIKKNVNIVALNHQPLRIMSGMAGLSFSK